MVAVSLPNGGEAALEVAFAFLVCLFRGTMDRKCHQVSSPQRTLRAGRLCPQGSYLLRDFLFSAAFTQSEQLVPRIGLFSCVFLLIRPF